MQLSRPAWARGLKQGAEYCDAKLVTSRPAWARGLKHHSTLREALQILVAPRVGATRFLLAAVVQNVQAYAQTYRRQNKPEGCIVD